MRLRNVKNKEEIMNNSSYLIRDYEGLKGNWKSLFKNDNPIYIEIGMGKGKFIIDNAKMFPNINFIGIEKFDSVIVKALQKIPEGLDNLIMLRADALNIDEIFDHEIDRIYLNFSDPWPKKRHTNRRLTSKPFLKLYDNLFKNSKHIIQKTDNRHLFEFSIMEFTSYGYQINELSLDLYSDNYEDNVPTEYETKFVNKGQVIYRIDVEKQ